MTGNGLAQIALYFLVLTGLAVPLSAWMERIYAGRAGWLETVLGPLERGLYRLIGPAAGQAQDWRSYAFAVLVFSGAGIVLLFVLQLAQAALPLNPQAQPAVPAALALNTAVSFVTNTNWQNYAARRRSATRCRCSD